MWVRSAFVSAIEKLPVVREGCDMPRTPKSKTEKKARQSVRRRPKNTRAAGIQMSVDSVEECLRILHVIVPSLDRLGSMVIRDEKDRYRYVERMFGELHVGAGMSRIRRLLLEAYESSLPNDHLERFYEDMNSLPLWRPSDIDR
jgi:hypothetical protein